MGQGGAKSRMRGVKSKAGQAQPKLHFVPVLETKTRVLHLQPCKKLDLTLKDQREFHWP